jgi:large subunit ribosomal protein L22
MEKLKIKKSVLIRQRKEEALDRKEENQGRQGATKAALTNVPTSPRKMRLVADLIRGKKVFQALNILKFEAKSGAAKIEKLLTTAIADWKEKNANIDIDAANLYVKEIYVDCGRMLKRLRPAPQGRGYRVRKRSNHIHITIDSMNPMVNQ